MGESLCAFFVVGNFLLFTAPAAISCAMFLDSVGVKDGDTSKVTPHFVMLGVLWMLSSFTGTYPILFMSAVVKNKFTETLKEKE